VILAQSLTRSPEHFKAVQQRFVHSQPEIFSNVLLFFLAAGVLVLVMWLYARVQQAHSRPIRAHPMGLYLHLMRQLHISLWARYCLWSLARKLKIEQPAALLISSDLFDDAVLRYRKAANVSTGTQATLAAVRAQLFPS